MRKLLLVMATLVPGLLAAQMPTPLEAGGFSTLTSYSQMMDHLRVLEERSALITNGVAGVSAGGREIPVLYFSKGTFGADPGKVKVLIFAQQHGNEQSGKEGALMLASRLVMPDLDRLFDRIDLALVPQVNPDGAMADIRRNTNGADLNRDHLVLGQPETQALHRLFDRFLFEVTMDVHEYYPYSEPWLALGYHKNSEITVGALTNVNIPGTIRDYQYGAFLPWLLDRLREQGFTAFEYLPGGPPGQGMVRRSTFDINDGRQSLGSQFTFSFIQEGMNGRDSLENMHRRAQGQMAGMMGLLEYTYGERDTLIRTVARVREVLPGLRPGDPKAVQMAHSSAGEMLALPVRTARTGRDSTVRVEDYLPRVEALETVTAPVGYLLPAGDAGLTAWVQRQGLSAMPYEPAADDRIEYYLVRHIGRIDFEGDTIPCPEVGVHTLERPPVSGEYLLVPVRQLKGNLLVQALEPRSMLGLFTYPPFRELVRSGEAYPVLRLVARGR